LPKSKVKVKAAVYPWLLEGVHVYADPSKLARRGESQGLDELRRRARRIFNLATVGFRQTLGNNEALNWVFLRLLIEANKLNNEITRLARELS